MNILTIIIYGFPLAGRKGNKKPLGRNQFRIKVKHGETRVNIEYTWSYLGISINIP